MAKREIAFVFPEGFRTIKYVFKDNSHKRKMGIYLIQFGDKFYIGRAKDIGIRISGHQGRENEAFLKLLFNRTDIKITGSEAKIAKHLLDNPHILEAQVEMIEECSDIEDCKDCEYGWLKAVVHCGFHDMCLNSDFFTVVFNTEPDIEWLVKCGMIGTPFCLSNNL